MKTEEELIEEGRAILIEQLMEVIGRLQAMQMAGLFFDDTTKNGLTVAQNLIREARKP